MVPAPLLPPLPALGGVAAAVLEPAGAGSATKFEGLLRRRLRGLGTDTATSAGSPSRGSPSQQRPGDGPATAAPAAGGRAQGSLVHGATEDHCDEV